MRKVMKHRNVKPSVGLVRDDILQAMQEDRP